MIEHQYLRDKPLLLFRIVGEGGFDELLTIVENLSKDPEFQQGANCLMDVRKQTAVTGPINQVIEAAEVVSEEEYTQSARSAFILDRNNLEYETNVKKYLEGYILMCSASNMEHKIFYEEELQDALEYIGLEELPADSMLQF